MAVQCDDSSNLPKARFSIATIDRAPVVLVDMACNHSSADCDITQAVDDNERARALVQLVWIEYDRCV